MTTGASLGRPAAVQAQPVKPDTQHKPAETAQPVVVVDTPATPTPTTPNRNKPATRKLRSGSTGTAAKA